MIIGILKESPAEKRVAMLPSEVSVLTDRKVEILVEHKAGEGSYIIDKAYQDAGAKSVIRQEIFSQSDMVLSVNPPVEEDIGSFREGQVLCSVLNVLDNSRWLEEVRMKGITMLALDMVPRITKAQSMDILSSMATVSGYRAVIEAASLLPRFFPMFMSAAGTIKPARVLILGAGVAGLQAIAIARKIGAVVEVFDVRSAVEEEVLSLGGKFIEVEGAREDKAAGGYAVEQDDEYRKRQQELIQRRAVEADVIITTAQIPGRRAPVLICEETVKKMKPGSVIVDLAASSGGNCELSENGRLKEVNGVRIIGRSDYPSGMPVDASKMFGSNIVNLLKTMIDEEGNLNLDTEDEIIGGTTVVHNKEYVSPGIVNWINNNK